MIPMNDYVNEICLLLLCSLVTATQSTNSFSVVGLLLGIVLICAQSFNRERMRIAALVIFALISCVYSVLLSYLPLVAYAAMHERLWVVRFLWLVPFAAQVMSGDAISSQQLVWVLTLCTIASILGIRDVRRKTEYRGLQRAYDALREQALEERASLFDRGAVTKKGTLECETAEAAYSSSFFEGLTEREMAVANLVAEGMDNREISQKLFLSEGTVRNHISSILSKKGLKNRTQIAIKYFHG